VTACRQFAAGLQLSADNYNEFAYATAGDKWTYQDPGVVNANITGRTALREAASNALQASNTPGLSPDVGNPMRGWAAHATKLILVMGLHAGGDTINTSASGLNDDTRAVQLACAHAGTHA
jgi:hypothetical protein